jgi:glycosyltransferase involved in cell wall biosynthesis
MLGLERVVRFTGFVDPGELFPRLDCLVLTSLSEGQPLVLLEAMAAGVPSVTTDVGACRELLEGTSPEDRALGPSGIVCPIADHVAVARAIERCARDGELRARLIEAGIARVDRYYRRENVQAIYLELYERYRNRFVAGERFGGEDPPHVAEVPAGSAPWPA